jgi:hypothetical protein
MFNCPSRRQPIAYPFTNPTGFHDANRPGVIGKSNYAANGGQVMTTPNVGSTAGPASYAAGDTTMKESDWQACYGSDTNVVGVINLRSMRKMAEITDGASNTYLAGEKYLCPDYYFGSSDWNNDWMDDQGWAIGYDYDVNRWVAQQAVVLTPAPDQPGYFAGVVFGSAHAIAFHMAFCDGSVQFINYAINPETHRRLGNYKDGQAIDGKTF